MGLPQEVRSQWLALVESGNARQVVYPAPNARTAAVSDGAAVAGAYAAYVEICAAAVITNPSWLLGIELDTSVVEAFSGDFAIAIGAGAAEVDIAVFPSAWDFGALAGTSKPTSLQIPAMYPIKIVGAPRVAVRLRKSTGASAAGCSLSLILGEAIGN